MKPLTITARLLEGFVSHHPIHLDALLAAAYCQREGMLLPPLTLADCKPVPVPLQRSECGRYWLASAGIYEPLVSELRHWHRRAPWVEYARLGTDKIRRIQISSGGDKSYRVPYELKIPRDGIVKWWAIGDRSDVLSLLQICHYMGKRRGSGKGRVAEWAVEERRDWVEGFPVMRDGKTLRNIPANRGAMRRIEPPYWLKEGLVPCAVP